MKLIGPLATPPVEFTAAPGRPQTRKAKACSAAAFMNQRRIFQSIENVFHAVRYRENKGMRKAARAAAPHSLALRIRHEFQSGHHIVNTSCVAFTSASILNSLSASAMACATRLKKDHPVFRSAAQPRLSSGNVFPTLLPHFLLNIRKSPVQYI